MDSCSQERIIFITRAELYTPGQKTYWDTHLLGYRPVRLDKIIFITRAKQVRGLTGTLICWDIDLFTR